MTDKGKGWHNQRKEHSDASKRGWAGRTKRPTPQPPRDVRNQGQTGPKIKTISDVPPTVTQDGKNFKAFGIYPDLDQAKRAVYNMEVSANTQVDYTTRPVKGPVEVQYTQGYRKTQDNGLVLYVTPESNSKADDNGNLESNKPTSSNDYGLGKTYSITNRQVKIIKAKPWNSQGFRVVLVQWDGGAEYSSHVQSKEPSESHYWPVMFSGHYFRTEKSALDDFNTRGV